MLGVFLITLWSMSLSGDVRLYVHDQSVLLCAEYELAESVCLFGLWAGIRLIKTNSLVPVDVAAFFCYYETACLYFFNPVTTISPCHHTCSLTGDESVVLTRAGAATSEKD